MPFSPADALDRLDHVISAARKAGADSVDAILIEESSQSISWRLGALEDVSRSEGIDLGLRVFKGQKVASVSTSDLSAVALDRVVARAIAMAARAPEDPFAGLAEASLLSMGPHPDLHLAASDLPSTAQLRQWAAEAEDAARAVPGVTNSEGAGASSGYGLVALGTSAGFRGAYASTSVSVSASVIAERDGLMERDYAYHAVRHPSDLEAAAVIGADAGRRAVRRLGAFKPASAVLPVVFDPRVSGSLVGHLLGAISGQAIARKSSFLQDSMGQQIFAPGISILDDPLRRRGLRSRPFDAEGLPARQTVLVKDGILQTWLLDLASARQLGLAPTGHASRAVSSPPSPGASNVHLAAGTVSPAALMADIKLGVYVTEMIGSGINGVTGDYSRGAVGFLIENGELTRPVSELTIASTLQHMFKNLIAADDLDFRYGVNAPTVRVDGMTIAGA
jgi:PmbA protein